MAQATVNVNEGIFAGYTLKTGTLYTGTSYTVPSNIVPIGVKITGIKQSFTAADNYFYIQTNLGYVFQNYGSAGGTGYNEYDGTILLDSGLNMTNLKKITKIDCRTNYINGTTFKITVWLQKN